MAEHFHATRDHHYAVDELHRRIAPPSTTNTLVWHLGLWISNPGQPFSNEEAWKIASTDDRRDNFNRALNQHLKALLSVLTNGTSADELSKRWDISGVSGAKDFETAPMSPTVRLIGDGFVWQINVAQMFEFTTITVYLHVDPEGKISQKDQDAIESGSPRFEWPEALSDISVNSIRHAFRSIAESDLAASQLEMGNHSYILHEYVWLTLSKAVLADK